MKLGVIRIRWLDSESRRGMVSVEYAMMLALISAVLISTLQQLGTRMSSAFERVGLELLQGKSYGDDGGPISFGGQAPEASTPASNGGSTAKP